MGLGSFDRSLEARFMTLAMAARAGVPAAALAFPAVLDARDDPGDALEEKCERCGGKTDGHHPEPWVEKSILPWRRVQELLENRVIRPG